MSPSLRRLALAIIPALLSSGPGAAGLAAGESPAPSPPPATAPLSPADVLQERQRLALELLAGEHQPELLAVAAAVQTEAALGLHAAWKTSDPERYAHCFASVQTLLQRQFTIDNLGPELAHIRAGRFTAPELTALSAFYASPLGQRYAAASLAVRKEVEIAAHGACIDYMHREIAKRLTLLAMGQPLPGPRTASDYKPAAGLSEMQDRRIREFMAAARLMEGIEAGYEAGFGEMERQVSAAVPVALQPQVKPMANSLRADIPALAEDLRPQLVAVYARTLAPEEITALLAFLRSPLGRRLSEEQPIITVQDAQLMTMTMRLQTTGIEEIVVDSAKPAANPPAAF